MPPRLLTLLLALAAQPPRQIDATLLDNPFLRVHLVTLNDVNHYQMWARRKA
ncbi:MAG: hypothetical protein HY048_19550 [Acidobacteria bacterium]|nr:hypothetical protein [Acidobacteriota bacterium]